MRHSVDELNRIPPDYRNDSAKEFAPLPDEFNRFSQPAKRMKKRSSMRKVMLYLAATGLVTLGVITPVVRVLPEENPPVAEATEIPAAQTPDATEPPVPTRIPTPKPTETATPEPTEIPTPEPTLAPALTGKIHVVVYSDIFDSNQAPYPSKILADDTIDASSFERYPLPPLPTQDGYRALGYVLTRYSGLAYLDSLYFDNADPRPIGTAALGDALTIENLLIVPKGEDEIYEAEVHVVWLKDGSNFHLEFYDGADLFGEYYIGFPAYSEQLCYLAAFPTPERMGKTFTGWCNAMGQPIDAVTYFDFFEELSDAQTMEDRDWEHPIPCRVYACWSDGSGGAPPVTPKPTEAPTPTPIPMCQITCQGCEVLIDGGYSRSNSVPLGTQVNIYAWSIYPYAKFVLVYADGRRDETDPREGRFQGESDSGGQFFYSYSFTVDGDVTVTLTRVWY